MTSRPSARSCSAIRSTLAAFDVSTTPRRALDQLRTCAAMRAASPWTTGGEPRLIRGGAERTNRGFERDVDATIDRRAPSPSARAARPSPARHVAATASVSSRSSSSRSRRRARTRSGSTTRRVTSLSSSSSVVGSSTNRRHPALHAVKELTGRESIEHLASPRLLLRRALRCDDATSRPESTRVQVAMNASSRSCTDR